MYSAYGLRCHFLSSRCSLSKWPNPPAHRFSSPPTIRHDTSPHKAGLFHGGVLYASLLKFLSQKPEAAITDHSFFTTSTEKFHQKTLDDQIS